VEPGNSSRLMAFAPGIEVGETANPLYFAISDQISQELTVAVRFPGYGLVRNSGLPEPRVA
jgi:hypothetical protein